MFLQIKNISDGDTHHTTLNSLRGDCNDYAVFLMMMMMTIIKRKNEQTKDRRIKMNGRTDRQKLLYAKNNLRFRVEDGWMLLLNTPNSSELCFSCCLSLPATYHYSCTTSIPKQRWWCCCYIFFLLLHTNCLCVIMMYEVLRVLFKIFGSLFFVFAHILLFKATGRA